MKLYTPSKEEAAGLLAGPAQFRGLSICEFALPPAFLLERAIAAEDGGWSMPRLFCDESNAQIVGSGAFKSEPRNRKLEIGYGVAPARRCRGFATEGVRLLAEEAFSSGLVDEVLAEVSPENEASRRVLEKAGFTIYGSGEDDAGPVNRWVKKKEPKQPLLRDTDHL
jgi:ribosomal-protein-alanine N-acetyltransferase